jgi:hypothetical protein
MHKTDGAFFTRDSFKGDIFKGDIFKGDSFKGIAFGLLAAVIWGAWPVVSKLVPAVSLTVGTSPLYGLALRDVYCCLFLSGK